MDSKNIHHYQFINKIGYGSFGSVWKVLDQRNNQFYACKLIDSKDQKRLSVLKKEISILKQFEKNQGENIIKNFPQNRFSINTRCHLKRIKPISHNDITWSKSGIFDKLKQARFHLKLNFQNSSVNNISNIRQNQFSTTFNYLVIHNLGIIHRDIKPQNIVATLENSNQFQIIDFGLSKHYIVRGQHISYKENKGMVGTPRFCSKWTMQGLEQSRRDDLYSIGYMLIYFIKGNLPWGNIQGKGDKIQKLRKIKYLKETISLNQLCFECPMIISDYMNYVDKLKFADKPNYDYLICLFQSQISSEIDLFIFELNEDYEEVKKQLERWVELERQNLNSSMKVNGNETGSNGSQEQMKQQKQELRIKLQKDHMETQQYNSYIEPIKTVYVFESKSMNLGLK